VKKKTQWGTQRNPMTGQYRVGSPEVGLLLDAATGEPAQLTQAESVRACQSLYADTKEAPLVERVS
jgi:hypothetical protein